MKLVTVIVTSLLLAASILTFMWQSKHQEFKKSRFNLTKGRTEQSKRSEPSVLTTIGHHICDLISSGDFKEDYLVFTLALSITVLILLWNFLKTRLASKSRYASAELFPVPVKPFDKNNRFVTAVVYAAYTYSILRIFETHLIGHNFIRTSTDRFTSSVNLTFDRHALADKLNNAVRKIENPDLERGILVYLLEQILGVLIIGFRYYPVLLCYELKPKSKFCFSICALYTWFLLAFHLYTKTKCQRTFEIFDFDFRRFSVLSSNFSSFFNWDLKNNVKDFKSRVKENMTRNVTDSEKPEYPVNMVLENFAFYAILCLMAVNTTCVLVQLVAEKVIFQIKREKLRAKGKLICREYEKFIHYKLGVEIKEKVPFGENITEMMMAELKSSSRKEGVEEQEAEGSVSEETEVNYTKTLYNMNRASNRKSVSFVRYLFEKYIYKPRKDYRFSKQFINTQIIAFILLYYITSIVIRKSTLIVNLSSNFLVVLINFIFRTATPSSASPETSSFMSNSRTQMNIIVKALFAHVSTDIIVSCLIATSIYVVQLLLGIRNYHKHILNAYKGVYVDIPAPKRFSNVKMTSSSLHYSGYAIGYMLWGYLILFEITAIVVVLVRFLIAFYVIAENIAKVVLPILTIFMFKRLFIWYLSRYFLTGRSMRGLKNRKLYFILNHFNFFFDCFLGSFVCFVRVLKSGLAALFFMPRLDYSIFGRYLERTDMGFISYVTFIHMEVNQTHPVKLAFCKLLLDSHPKRAGPDSGSDSDDDDDESYDQSSAEQRRRSRTIKNKWLVAYTLIKYPYLKKQRKRYLHVQGYVPKVESFEQFLERHTRGVFSSKDQKKKSQSTPSLNALDLSVSTAMPKPVPYNYRTSTLNPKADYEPRKKAIAANVKDFSFSTNNTNFSNDSIDIVTGSISNNNQIKHQNRHVNRPN